jgi:hypothetical protein
MKSDPVDDAVTLTSGGCLSGNEGVFYGPLAWTSGMSSALLRSSTNVYLTDEWYWS